MYPQFTKEIIHPTTPKRFVTLLFAAVFLYLAINATARWFFIDRIEANMTVCPRKTELIETLDRPVDILIAGDSAGAQSVSPAMIEERTGRSSINVCTIGRMLLVDDLAFFREYLRKFGKGPKMLLLIHVYDIWPRKEVRYVYPREQRFIEAAGIKTPFASRWYVIDRIFNALPLMARRLGVRRCLQGSTSFRNDDRGYYQATENFPEFVAQDLKLHRAGLAKGDWTVREIHFDILAEILSLARQHDTQVVLAFAPAIEDLYRDPAYQKTVADLRRQFVERCGTDHFTVLAPTLSVSPRLVGNTVDHVLHPAALRYTEYLLDRIEPLLATPTTAPVAP